MMRNLFRLQNKIFLAFAVVAGGLLLCVLIDMNIVINHQAAETIADDLQHALKVFDGVQRERTANLARLLQNISEAPRLKAALDLKRQDPATVADLATEIKSDLALFQVADKKGRLLAGFMGAAAMDVKKPDPAAPAFDGFFGKAVDPENPLVSTGALTWSNRLFLTITGPVIDKERVIGGLRAGYELAAQQANDLKDQTGGEVAFTVGNDKIVATSLSPAMTAALEAKLHAMGADIAKMAGMATFEAELDRTPFLVRVAPLNDPAGQSIGYQIQLRSKSRALALLHKIRSGIGVLIFVGVALSLILAYFITRGVTSPLKALVQGTRAVERGDLDYRIAVKTRDELGVLADAFNAMVADLKEKERVKAVFGKYLPKAVADRAMAHQGELQLGGEERDVAILFSDVRGFTAISENIPPTRLVAMLNEYFTKMVDVLLEHEGTLDKYIGDAIMAVFGAPVADTEAAAKAVATALGMQAASRALNREFAAKGFPALEIGIGVNAGPVVAGNLGSVKQLSYTVIGEQVNLASRLCSKATKGQVLISDAVFQKVKWRFQCNRLEPITVKNVSYPVQVHEVTGVREDTVVPTAGA